MSQGFRYVALIDGEKMRAFNSRIELEHWMSDKPEATFVRYKIKREKKEKINLDEFEPCLM